MVEENFEQEVERASKSKKRKRKFHGKVKGKFKTIFISKGYSSKHKSVFN